MKTAYVVLGAPRSGTSAVSSALDAAGVFFGNPARFVDAGVHAHNPVFFELQAWNGLNDAIMAVFGKRFGEPFLPLEEDFERPELAGIARQAVKAVEDEFAQTSPVGLKDPRFCLTFPFWRRLLAGMGYELRPVFVQRAAGACTASNAAVNREWPLWRNCNIWVLCNLAARYFLRDASYASADYDQLMTAGLPAVRQLLDSLGMADVPAERVAACFQARQRHHGRDEKVPFQYAEELGRRLPREDFDPLEYRRYRDIMLLAQGPERPSAAGTHAAPREGAATSTFALYLPTAKGYDEQYCRTAVYPRGTFRRLTFDLAAPESSLPLRFDPACGPAVVDIAEIVVRDGAGGHVLERVSRRRTPDRLRLKRPSRRLPHSRVLRIYCAGDDPQVFLALPRDVPPGRALRVTVRIRCHSDLQAAVEDREKSLAALKVERDRLAQRLIRFEADWRYRMFYALYENVGLLSTLTKLRNAGDQLAGGQFRVLARNLRHELRHRRGLAPPPGTPPAEPSRAAERYPLWIKRFDSPSEDHRAAAREAVRDCSYRPLLSVVMPTFNTPGKLLREALDSVLGQTYEHWELCAADDASPDPAVVLTLREYAGRDPRVKVSVRDRNGHISACSNTALGLAGGEFVVFMDHDDLLHPHALGSMVEELNRNPSLDVLFSDHDLCSDSGRRDTPYFKLGYSPELILQSNYMAHLLVVRRQIVTDAGGFREGFEGSQDHDLILRLLERTDRVKHVPAVLYHWRRHAASTAGNPESKRYAHDNAVIAVRESLRRRGEDAQAEGGRDLFTVRVRYARPAEGRVSILIPFRDREEDLKRCLTSIVEHEPGAEYEILLLDNGTQAFDVDALASAFSGDCRLSVHPFNRPFNYSAINNFGAGQAGFDYLLLLNNDTEITHDDWLGEMLSLAARRDVGAVGTLLTYPDGRIQHAGVVLGLTGLAGHIYQGLREEEAPWGVTRFVRDVTAVTGACLMTRRRLYLELGGLDERFGLCGNDVDYCLRVSRRGLRVLYTPFARLVHFESLTRRGTPIPAGDFAASLEAYKPLLERGDPFYNPNLSLLSTAGVPKTEDETARLSAMIESAGAHAARTGGGLP